MTDYELVKHLFIHDKKSGDLLWRVERRGRHSPCVGRSATSRHCRGYRTAPFRGQQRLVHRLVWLYYHRAWPKEIDHINGDRTDNRIENLRECTRSQNNGNRSVVRSDNSSGVTGVYWIAAKKKFRAEIKFEGKKKNLGYFSSLEAAAAARRKAEDKVFGEFSPNRRPE